MKHSKFWIYSIIFISAPAFAAIDPVRSFDSAIKVAQLAAKASFGNARVFAGSGFQGKYLETGSYPVSQYIVTLDLASTESTRAMRCTSQVTIARVPFDKQPPNSIILEEVGQQYKVIGEVQGQDCRPLNFGDQ